MCNYKYHVLQTLQKSTSTAIPFANTSSPESDKFYRKEKLNKKRT